MPPGRDRFAILRLRSLRDHEPVLREQIGINSHLYGYRGFSLDGAFKFAMGAIEQQADISGNNTTISSTGVVTTQARGLYA